MVPGIFHIHFDYLCRSARASALLGVRPTSTLSAWTEAITSTTSLQAPSDRNLFKIINKIICGQYRKSGQGLVKNGSFMVAHSVNMLGNLEMVSMKVEVASNEG